jgi:hypothetical protein
MGCANASDESCLSRSELLIGVHATEIGHKAPPSDADATADVQCRQLAGLHEIVDHIRRDAQQLRCFLDREDACVGRDVLEVAAFELSAPRFRASCTPFFLGCATGMKQTLGRRVSAISFVMPSSSNL